MPIMIPLLLGATVFTTGAFVGAQIDDKIDTPPVASPVDKAVDVDRIALYGLGALLIYIGLKKTGFM